MTLCMSCLHQCQRRPASPILARTEALAVKGTAASAVLVLMDTPGSSVKPVKTLRKDRVGHLSLTDRMPLLMLTLLLHIDLLLVWMHLRFWMLKYPTCVFTLEILMLTRKLSSHTHFSYSSHWLLCGKWRDIHGRCQHDRRRAGVSGLALLFHFGKRTRSFHHVLRF